MTNVSVPLKHQQIYEEKEGDVCRICCMMYANKEDEEMEDCCQQRNVEVRPKKMVVC